MDINEKRSFKDIILKKNPCSSDQNEKEYSYDQVMHLINIAKPQQMKQSS